MKVGLGKHVTFKGSYNFMARKSAGLVETVLICNRDCSLVTYEFLAKTYLHLVIQAVVILVLDFFLRLRAQNGGGVVIWGCIPRGTTLGITTPTASVKGEKSNKERC